MILVREIFRKRNESSTWATKVKTFGILGAYIVTIDEFEDLPETKYGEPNLLIQAFVNGKKWSEENLAMVITTSLKWLNYLS